MRNNDSRCFDCGVDLGPYDAVDRQPCPHCGSEVVIVNMRGSTERFDVKILRAALNRVSLLAERVIAKRPLEDDGTDVLLEAKSDHLRQLKRAVKETSEVLYRLNKRLKKP